MVYFFFKKIDNIKFFITFVVLIRKGKTYIMTTRMKHNVINYANQRQLWSFIYLRMSSSGDL